jgi:glycosyltransferase involved in cell wall biosynthesis
MFLVDSLYINNSGGKVLLDYLVFELEKKEINPFYLFDIRCKDDFKEIPNKRKVFLKANTLNRYRFYKHLPQEYSSIFCFGNVPPPIKLNIPVYTYFHHGGILSDFPMPFKSKFKNILKRIFISFFSKNTTYFVFQSKFVRDIFYQKINTRNKTSIIIPFFGNIKPVYNKTKKENKFLYVSGGNIYKNHRNLLKAWKILAEKNFYPELHLTVTQNYPLIIKEIEDMIDMGIKIKNHGFTNVIPLYEECKFLIYPSFIETFGLGLIEATMFNCDVVASDRQYVYEVIKPSKVFNPNDVIDIAESVIYVLKSEVNKTKLLVDNKIDELIKLLTQ